MSLGQFEILHLAVGYLNHYAELRLETALIVDDDTRRVELHRKPLGVVAAVVQCNEPVFIAYNKITPALCAGDGKSVGSGKSVEIRVDIGGGRVYKKKRRRGK